MAAAAETSPFRVVHTVCSHDCPDSCAVLVTVDAEGRAVKVQGDPSQPVTQGFFAARWRSIWIGCIRRIGFCIRMRRKAGCQRARWCEGREHEAFERDELG